MAPTRFGGDLEEYEFPDPDDEDDGEDTVPCPLCGGDVYDDAQACPHCGEWISANTHAWSQRRWWWVLLGALGIVAVLYSSLHVFGP